MINPYRSLAENLPERRRPGRDAIQNDPRRLKEWIEGLPRANQDVYLQELMKALADLRVTLLEGFARLEALEILRPSLLELTVLLKTRLQGSSFPLTDARAEAAARLLALHGELALEYRLAVVEACAPAGKVPFMRGGQVSLALVRAMYHHVRWLATCHFLYRSPEPGIWKNIYALAAFAADHKLDGKPVDDAVERRPLAVGTLRNQAVLLSLANPYRFNQKTLTELWNLTRDLAALVTVTPERFAASGALMLTDGDAPPSYATRAPDLDEGLVLWVDLRRLNDLVRASLSHAGGGEQALVRMSRNVQLSVPVAVLQRALEGWAQDASRVFPRLEGGYTLDSVVGLTALHYHLVGKKDFAGFMREMRGIGEATGDRAAWAQGGGEGSQADAVKVRVQDQSLNGYRLRWEPNEENHAVRARIGELVGVALPTGDTKRDWAVGTVRWLRYDEHGAIEAGIDLVARRVIAVGLRGLDATGGTHTPVRALRLEAPMQFSDEPDTEVFLVPALAGLQTPQVEVVRNGNRWDSEEFGEVRVYNCKELKARYRAGDYLMVVPESG